MDIGCLDIDILEESLPIFFLFEKLISGREIITDLFIQRLF